MKPHSVEKLFPAESIAKDKLLVAFRLAHVKWVETFQVRFPFREQVHAGWCDLVCCFIYC